jgi:hypothetical protein
MTAAAVSAAINPEAAISPARHAAQKVIVFRSPSAAPTTFRTKLASAYSSGIVTLLSNRAGDDEDCNFANSHSGQGAGGASHSTGSPAAGHQTM